MSIAYQRFVIDELPKGPLEERHFRLEEGVLPALEAGQVAVRVILISQDAANRAWLQGATYRGAVQTGDVMPSGAIAEVLASEDSAFAPGNWSTAISAGKATRSWQGPRSARSAPTAP